MIKLDPEVKAKRSQVAAEWSQLRRYHKPMAKILFRRLARASKEYNRLASNVLFG